MKRQSKDTEDKRLMAARLYLNLYVSTLEEVVKDDGRIYLREYGDEYAKVCIVKKSSKCWVGFLFWEEFSELFSLQYNEVELIMSRWVEDTYQLTGIYAVRTRLPFP